MESTEISGSFSFQFVVFKMNRETHFFVFLVVRSKETKHPKLVLFGNDHQVPHERNAAHLPLPPQRNRPMKETFEIEKKEKKHNVNKN
jgi:hypothetical protein